MIAVSMAMMTRSSATSPCQGEAVSGRSCQQVNQGGGECNNHVVIDGLGVGFQCGMVHGQCLTTGPMCTPGPAAPTAPTHVLVGHSRHSSTNPRTVSKCRIDAVDDCVLLNGITWNHFYPTLLTLPNNRLWNAGTICTVDDANAVSCDAPISGSDLITSPQGSALDAQGENVYVVNRDPKKIYRCNLASSSCAEFGHYTTMKLRYTFVLHDGSLVFNGACNAIGDERTYKCPASWSGGSLEDTCTLATPWGRNPVCERNSWEDLTTGQVMMWGDGVLYSCPMNGQECTEVRRGWSPGQNGGAIVRAQNFEDSIWYGAGWNSGIRACYVGNYSCSTIVSTSDGRADNMALWPYGPWSTVI